MRVVSKVSTKVSQTKLTSTEFMDWAPRGAYTTARTIKSGDRVFELPRHIERLVTSSKPFVKGAIPDQKVRRLALAAIEDAMDGSRELMDSSDCKLTVVIAVKESEGDGKDVEAYAHIEAMKAKDLTKPIYVALGGPPRENAVVKDSKWVHDRKSIVDTTAEETLLLGKDGTVILEGSQTNFFAVLPSGAVYTAKDGILEGTVRAAVIDACKVLGIPLVLEAPAVSDLEDYKEAFIASTSRLVMPIDVLGARRMPNERPVTEKIAEWVKKHVEDRSVSVKEFSRTTLATL